ncbi:MAG: hypothetical protein LBJ81_00115 [Puniceicoccales bacterium]|jgi:hypothetical protein|nr:hypothetical protein [Puniceicoccales bacterium]
MKIKLQLHHHGIHISGGNIPTIFASIFQELYVILRRFFILNAEVLLTKFFKNKFIFRKNIDVK